jgi:hypothetical protein
MARLKTATPSRLNGLQPAIFPDQSTNDLINLQLGSIRAEIHNSPPYHIYGKRVERLQWHICQKRCPA